MINELIIFFLNIRYLVNIFISIFYKKSIMQKFVKNTFLTYISNNIKTEVIINPLRVFDLNNYKISTGKIVYLCERELRVKDNFALQLALEKSREFNLPLKIIHPKIFYKYLPKQNFIEKQIENTKKDFINNNLDFEVLSDNENILDYLKKLNTSILIIDFNPILNRKWLKNTNFKIYEIDSHNIIPARFISDKQEYGAVTLRRKIYNNIYSFLTEYPKNFSAKTEAENVLQDFIKNKLPYYSELKNNPTKNVLSNLSKYLNLGFISSQRVALEVIKSNVSEGNKETFLEELIIRKELADNFCLYCKNFKSLKCIPNWAKVSLEIHKNDLRNYIYTEKELENSKTHDKLWNATQIQLKTEGVIHGYLRMYWAKKILEWSPTPQEALKTAIYLNDKYAYDSPSSNGYVGILWAIGGLHDRAFKDFIVTGKTRRMTFNSLSKKFDIYSYINTYIH